MATTPIYTFTTPDLTGTADGPAAMAALATRVEREMSTFRSAQEFSQEPNSNWNAGTTDNLIYSITVATAVIGWITIDAYANLAAAGGNTSNVTQDPFAGYLKVLVDDVLIRTLRFHNLWGTRTLPIAVNAAAARTAAQTSTNIKLKLDVGSGGLGVSVNHTAIYVCQYGAPGTG